MRIAGNLDLDGQTIKLDQGGNSTTITSNSPASDITLTLPNNASGLLVNCETGGDATKEVTFDSSGATTAKEMTIASSHTDDRTLTMPDATDTLVGRATTDTLTNKTLTSPTINTPTLTVNDASLTIQDNADTSKKLQFQVSGVTTSTTRTLTVPDANTTIVGTDATQTLTNKTLTTPTVTVNDNAWTMQDNADTTKKLNFQLSGITTSTTRTLTIPDANTTLVGTDATQTLTNKTLTSPVLTTPTMTAGSNLTLTQQAELRLEDDSGGQYVGFVASTGTTTHSYNFPTAQGGVNTVLCNDGSGNLTWNGALTTALTENYIQIGDNTNTAASTDTAAQGDILADDVTGLTIKSGVTITSPVLTTPQINDTSADHQYVFAVSELAADRTVTLPLLTGNDEFVFKDHTQTLTNKTLTTPVIASISNSGTITVPTGTDTLVGRATTDTLTNKTLTSPSLTSPTVSGTVTLSTTPTYSGAVTFSGGAISLDNAVTINESGANVDFRVEGDTEPNLLFIDASADSIGIGTSTPGAQLHIANEDVNDNVTIKLENDVRSWAIAVRGDTGDGLHIIDNTAGSFRATFDTNGRLGIGNTAPEYKLHVQETANFPLHRQYATHSTLTATMSLVDADRAANSAYRFLTCRSTLSGATDTEFILRGDGQAYADGSWNGSGADYAEYFESTDGTALPVGHSVVLDGDGVRLYDAGVDNLEDIIGVTRPKGFAALGAVLKGNSAWNMWNKKYITDKWGVYIMEPYTVTEWQLKDGTFETYESDKIPADIIVPEDAVVKTTDDEGRILERRKLNPDFSEEVEYISREERDEWQLIGLIGQVPVEEGQPARPSWRKMREAVDGVEWWYIR